MYGSKWIRIGAISGALGVSIGALGLLTIKTSLQAKVEATTLNAEEMVTILDNWSTATEYMMYHSIAIVLVGLVSIHLCSKFLTWAGSFFTAGILGLNPGSAVQSDSNL